VRALQLASSERAVMTTRIQPMQDLLYSGTWYSNNATMSDF